MRLDGGDDPVRTCGGHAQGIRWNMTENKKTVERFMDGFNKSNHEQILSCLTEDVEWEMPGAFHLVGKNAFDKEIENDAFVGSPTITITRTVEENDVVIAEGAVRVKKKDDGLLNAVFCDVFVMKNAKIKRLTSYLVELNLGRSTKFRRNIESSSGN
jgi:ketosteroid isomerase-like protein